MFGNESGPSRIWSFGARAPTRNLDVVNDQIRLARVYRNQLCELELERRRRADEVLHAHYPDLGALEGAADALAARLEEVRGRIRQAKQAGRPTSDLRAEAAALRRELAPARVALRDRRRQAWADAGLRDDLDQAEAWAQARQRELRRESRLYWGTYLTVEQACQSFRRGPPPRFRRWNGEGKVAVQIQGGMTWDEATGCEDTRFRLRLEPSGRNVVAGSRRSQLRRRYTAWLRVGSEGRSPVWACVPVVLHRRPPEGAVVKWIYLHRSRQGTHENWELQLVLERKEDWDRPVAGGDGRVGIDLGWRLLPSGDLRVAYWAGSDDAHGQLVIPAERVSGWDRAESLRSTRDRNFDRLRQQLGAWLLATPGLPEWLAAATEYLALWRSPSRLARVVRDWRDRRFKGDEYIFPAAEAWRRQDRHLADWEAFQRLKMARWRDDLYRNFAAETAGRYGRLAVEDTKWTELAALPTPESGEAAVARVRYLQRVASVGRLAQVLCERFGAGNFVKVPAEYTTRACHHCTRRDEWDQARDLEHTCSGCDRTWDQDYNAAVWLLRGGVP